MAECPSDEDVFPTLPMAAPVSAPVAAGAARKPKASRKRRRAAAPAAPPLALTHERASWTPEPVPRLTAPRQSVLSGWAGVVPPAPVPVPEGGYLVVDLFCSIGGVSVAAKELGHTVVLGVDMDAKRLAVHALNFPDAEHLQLRLGPDTEAQLLERIHTLVPPEQRHRLWLHVSPPCQAQSNMHRIATNANLHAIHAQKAQEKVDGLATVRWALQLVVKLQPAQFSLEEVPDGGRRVVGLLQQFKRAHPSLVDFEVLRAVDFGVPQTRPRVIGGRPATMHALRLAPSLRAPRPVSVRDVVDAATIPDRAVFIHGPKHLKVKVGLARRCPETPGTHTDGFCFWHELDRPGPTIHTQANRWLDESLQFVCTTDAHFHQRMMTFPDWFAWHHGTTLSAKREGYGNAVPPALMRAVFRAASTSV